MKGIVRSLKPNEKFFEHSWEAFYKLYLHMKYGQGNPSLLQFVNAGSAFHTVDFDIFVSTYIEKCF